MKHLNQLQKELEQIQKAKVEAISDQNFELTANCRQREKELLKEIEGLKLQLGIQENLSD